MDLITEAVVGKKNIIALYQQLKLLQTDQQASLERMNQLSSQVASLSSSLEILKQQFFVLKAKSMGHGSTSEG
jgi:hypothetical protein